MKCLFEDYQAMPKQLSEIVDRHEQAETYKELEAMKKEVESIGFTFDYYLDATPYGLRPIGVKLEQLEGFEDN